MSSRERGVLNTKTHHSRFQKKDNRPKNLERFDRETRRKKLPATPKWMQIYDPDHYPGYDSDPDDYPDHDPPQLPSQLAEKDDITFTLGTSNPYMVQMI